MCKAVSCIIFIIRNISPFAGLNDIPEDSIFQAAKRAKSAGPTAINGTIGMILNENGKPLVFPSVKKALQEINLEDTGYPPLRGYPNFLESVYSLVFESDVSMPSIATPGGTGALSILLRIGKTCGYNKLILPTPTWANHSNIAKSMGYEVIEVPYLKDNISSFEEVITFINKVDDPHILLLQAGCHNPTGLDVSLDSWKALVKAIKDSLHCILLDFPYQGIGNGIDEDANPIKILREEEVNFMIAWSASKNHCLYGLRCGCAFAYEPDDSMHNNIQKHLNASARSLFSVAPITGQKVVSLVQSKYKNEWEKDLENLRELLLRKRKILAEALPQISENILSTNGMFLKLPLSVSQIEKLYEEKVFLTPDARVNIAGIPESKIEEFGSRVSKYLEV